ncbi:MAG: hypothetical protein EOP37_16070 [Rubrivivax sp.]|nr:MAG: hypothetical protein EOP37_16070 [Rubrivivax sp.]
MTLSVSAAGIRDRNTGPVDARKMPSPADARQGGFFRRLMARAPHSLHRLHRAHADSFSAVKADYDRLIRRAQVEGLFDDGEAQALRDRLLGYIKRKERGGYESQEKGQAKLNLAVLCLQGIAQLPRNHAATREPVHHPKALRTALACRAQAEESPTKRAAQVRQWRGALPKHRLSDSTTQLVVDADDGLPVFRLLAIPPAPTGSGAVREATKAALRVAMGAAMHADLRRQAGIDFCLPRATVGDPLCADEPRVVIVDAIDGSPSPGRKLPDVATLQRAVVGQWMLGHVRPVWSDFGVDANGRFVSQHTALSARGLSEICERSENVLSASGLFMTPDGKSPSELAGRPLEADLRSVLLRLDLLAMDKAFVHTQVDLATSGCLGRAGERRETPLGDASVLDVLGIERMAPLRALQRAVAASDASTPFEAVLAEASEALRGMERERRLAEAPRRGIDPPANPSKARKFAERVRRVASRLWRQWQPGKIR